MTTSSPYCPKCGGKNEPGAEVCFACGESLLAASVSPAGLAGASSAAMVLPNMVIKQRYRIIRRVGEGGFGAVYQAEDMNLGNRRVAVKEMRPSGALATEELQEATEAFRHEAILLASLVHPSLPRIYEHFSEGDHWYLVMDFIDGETLERRLERSFNKHLSVQEALQLGIKLCDVLEYLHTRQPPIIFRDLKPSNVMLTPDGQVYLVDFGIARLFKPGQKKDTMAFGSPGYAAPEQYGKAQTTPRSDVFSLGALLHQMLTGNDPSDTPFRFTPLTMPRPTGLGTFIGHMVSLDEYKRPPSMGMVRRELERLAAAWDERQRGYTSTTMFPSHQPATGYFPAVPPPRPTGTMPPQAGPHWMPPPQTGTMLPQSTGMMRPAARPQPYPAPSMVSMPTPPRRRRRFRWLWWLIPLVIFLTCGLPFFGVGLALLARSHSHAPSGPVGSVYTLAWSPHGTRIASAGTDNQVHIWDAATGKTMLTYRGHTDAVDWLAWSPDGKLMASASDDTTVQVWDASTGKTIYTYRGHTRLVNELAWSPDGKRIASASDDRTVQVWDATTGTHVYIYQQHTSQVWTVGWSPDGKYIASGGNDWTVRVWNAITGETVRVYQGHKGKVLRLAWSPDGKRIASIGEDKTLQVWDALSGDEDFVYADQPENQEAVAWSPNGQYLASGGDDNTVQVRDATTGSVLYTYRGHTDSVWEIAWSPNSQRIASASDDGTVQVWDALTGDHVLTYR